MNEEPKVSKLVTTKLRRYLNRERVEQRFDTSGRGVYRTHPLVVKLELAYLIANEDEKKRKQTEGAAVEEEEGKGRREKAKRSQKEPAIPKVKPLPQRKTRVQRSEVNRLAKNAHSALKTIDADKISTVYRFRQQMTPHEVRHQGKVRQVSTSVHAMLNAEEAWRYRKENDEREKVRKYKEQQKEKEKEEAAKAAREQELSRLPVGIRMEIKRQNEQQRNKCFLEKLLEPSSNEHTPRCSPNPQDVPTVADGNVADSEGSDYEDDFEEEDDEEGVDNQEENVHHESKPSDDIGASNRVTGEDKEEDEDFIAAVTTANDAGSISSLTASTYTAAASPSPSVKSRSRHGDGMSYDQEAQEAAYDDEPFESDTEDQGTVDDQSVFMTDVDPDSLAGSRGNSRAPSPTKSPHLLQIDDDDDDAVSHSTVASEKHVTKLQGHEVERPGSAEVAVLASQLAKTAVNDAALSVSSMSVRSTKSSTELKASSRTESKGDGNSRKERQKDRTTTQEYTRTESVVSLSDRVKKDLDKEMSSSTGH